MSLKAICWLLMDSYSTSFCLMLATAWPANQHGAIAAQQRLLQNCMLARRQSFIVAAGNLMAGTDCGPCSLQSPHV